VTSGDLIEQALGMPDLEARKRLFQEHVFLLDDGCAEALKAQADQFLRSDIQRCRETAQLLIYQAELNGNPLHRALGLLAEANAHSIGLGEYQRGVDLYDEAAAIYEAHGELVRQARSQIGKIYALGHLGRYHEAQVAGDWASRVLEEHAQWEPLASLTLNLGILHGRLGEDARSLAYFDRARELYVQLGKEGDPLLSWIDQDRAIALRNLGRFEESIAANEGAWKLMSESGQTVEAARPQQALAVTYYVLGRYNEAMVHLEQARDVFLADGRRRDAILVELYTTDCLLQLRRFADVLDKCRQIRERFTELGTRFEVAQALLNEAVAYAGLGRAGEAIDSLAEARQLFTAEGNRLWIACTDLEMAVLYLQQARFEESLETAQSCARTFRAQGLPVREARARLIAARAAFSLNQYEQARRWVGMTLDLAESRDIPSLTYQGYHLRGGLAVAEGEPERALAEYDRAIREVERLRGRLMVEFRVGFVGDKQGIYEDMVDLCLRLGRVQEALEYTERAKSRALLDLLAYRLDLGVQARAETDRPLVDELARLRAERDRLYRRWEGGEEPGEESRADPEQSRRQAQEAVLAVEKRITETWHQLLVRNAGYARDASLWQVRTEPVQPYLRPETALLEYVICHGQLVAFVVTGERIDVHRLTGDMNQVQRLIQLLWLNLRAVPGGTLRQTAQRAANAQGLLRRLHDLLMAPLSAALRPYPRLIIVPHGSLHYLPFQALYDGTSFLVEQHEISYLPGASLLRYCVEAEPVDAGVLAFGHSYEGRLPHAIQEAESIAAILSAGVFVEERATLAQLREMAPDCQIIHLATHGQFRGDNPLFSGLALADGWLTTLDIFDLRLKASLVTLSACQTGQSVVSEGDELMGLMRAFLSAGAASIVLSLWTVEDRSAARLMETFYAKLAERWGKGAALRHAQLQLIAGRDSDDDAEAAYSHPYFWAPFFLVGESGPLRPRA
jgi:CHAT domain-containing protein